MAVSLAKGGNISLTKSALGAQDPNLANAVPDSGLANATVGLGWDVRSTTGAAFDLDASAILVDANNKVVDDKGFVFYGNLQSGDASVQHTGDNLTGQGDGDDEKLLAALQRVPANVQKIVFSVAIYDAEARQQNFGMVRNAFIRVLNGDNQVELARYDLSEDAAMYTAMIFGELYRNGSDWKFRAVGQGYSTGLKGIAQDFGVAV
jgi:tellurium resistance protein TerD